MSKYVKKGYMEIKKWIYLEPPRRIHLVCQVALFYITARVSFLIKMQPAFALNDTPAQMFSCEIYEVFKNTYFV